MNRERLIDAGVDYDEGVERFGGHPEIFERYLLKFFDSGFMTAIEQQLESKDITAAFRLTHDLKGAAGNLSLKAFFEAVCVLTERLRSGNSDTDYGNELKAVKECYERVRAAAEERE